MLLAAIAVLGALLAFGASGAFASTVEAKWGEATKSLRLQGAVTVERESGSSVNCSSATTTFGTAEPGSTVFSAGNEFGLAPYIKFNCEGNTKLQIALAVGSTIYWKSYAQYDSSIGYQLRSTFQSGGPYLASPFGSYTVYPITVPFANAGSTEEVEVENEEGEMEIEIIEIPNSLVKFSHNKIGGVVGTGYIYITGDLVVDDGSGNPRTLSH